MPKIDDIDYLKTQQYNNASKLAARINLHHRYNTNPQDFHHWLFDQLLANCSHEARILEVGCGRGDLWAKNIERMGQSWHVTLSDISAGMLDDARAYIGLTAGQFAYELADVQALPFDSGSFDHVVSHYMLHHVPDLPQAIRELHRVLKPGGTLHTSTVGDNHLHEIYEMMALLTPEIARERGDNVVGFTVQNGVGLLVPPFKAATYHPYNSSLRITEAQPLLDYILSMRGNEHLSTAQQHAYQAHIQAHIDAQGALDVTKETGLFIAVA